MKFFWQKFFRFFASVRTGIFLLLAVILLSAVGTIILQRPITEPVELERAYSPSTLQLLDRFQLTDIYHSWYFVTLLGLVILSIIFVSIDRWPNAWRYYSRPYRFAEPHFRASLPIRALIPVKNTDGALEAAERAFKKCGLPVEREVSGNEVALYSERSRLAEFAVYIVHASLIFLMLGYLLDLQVGYRGMMSLNEGDTTNQYTIRRGTAEIPHTLPFSIRCDEAKQENYTLGELQKYGAEKDVPQEAVNQKSGMPKSYSSKLAVIDRGREVLKKTIIVNDPLTYGGIRFYQSGMGAGDKPAFVDVTLSGGPLSAPANLRLAPQKEESAGPVSVSLARFIPEYYLQDGEVFTKSQEPRNPAIQLLVKTPSGQYPVWVLLDRSREVDEKNSGLHIELGGGKMAMMTVLQVSYQPGQYLIFPGVLLMVAGLMMVLFMAHTRHWAVVVNDPKAGRAIWVGGTSNRNKIRFQQKFDELVEAIKAEAKADGGDKIQTPELAKV